MNTIRKSIVLTVVLAVMVAPTAAFAQEDTSGGGTTTTVANDERTHRPLDELKARAQQMIDHQLGVLGRLRSEIGGSAHITDGHAAQLLGDISDAAAGLEELAPGRGCNDDPRSVGADPSDPRIPDRQRRGSEDPSGDRI